jgi:hypothetical protein
LPVISSNPLTLATLQLPPPQKKKASQGTTETPGNETLDLDPSFLLRTGKSIVIDHRHALKKVRAVRAPKSDNTKCIGINLNFKIS